MSQTVLGADAPSRVLDAPAPSVDWRRPWGTVPEILVVVCTGLLPLVMFASVMARYSGWFQTPWAADASRICFLWASFLGAALAVKYDAHVRLALLSDRIARAHEGRYRTAVVIFIHGSVLVVGTLLGIVGWDIVEVSMRRTMSALQVRRGYVDAAVPISGALMAFYSAKSMWLHLRHRGHGERREIQ